MRVLIVDDEPLVRRSLGRAFERRGHQVYEAEDGIKGLELWRQVSMDLVILDVLMPGLTGPQVLAQMGERRSGLVVLISAHSNECNAVSASTVGADHFEAKPFEDIFELVEKLEKLVQRE